MGLWTALMPLFYVAGLRHRGLPAIRISHKRISDEVDAKQAANGGQFRGGVPVCGVCDDRADDLSVCDQCGEWVCFSCLFIYRPNGNVKRCCWDYASKHSTLQLRSEETDK